VRRFRRMTQIGNRNEGAGRFLWRFRRWTRTALGRTYAVDFRNTCAVWEKRMLDWLSRSGAGRGNGSRVSAIARWAVDLVLRDLGRSWVITEIGAPLRVLFEQAGELGLVVVGHHVEVRQFR